MHCSNKLSKGSLFYINVSIDLMKTAATGQEIASFDLTLGCWCKFTNTHILYHFCKITHKLMIVDDVF